jgi:hypothetical protein
MNSYAKETQQYNYNLFKENKENNSLESNIIGLLNKQRNQNKTRMQQSSTNNLQANVETLDRLSEKHNVLIKNILSEEEQYTHNHKIHINEMIEIMNSVKY